ncbi:MAG: hypothetical protein A2X33_04915 [Elusimicrobia bacterium GWA2_51_34]|nr:MAG: hypothetical protein A2X33_04915 [Elusimicrobia bacterium GWA2_51_34]
MKNNGRSYIYGLAALLMALSGGTPAFSKDQAPKNIKEQIDSIQNLIKQKGGKWVAGETSLSNLSKEEWRMRVGLNFKALNAPALPELAAVNPPVSLDWRNSNGSYVTGIRNQAKCGSCWAFSLTAALESYILINRNTPGADLDLSEQVMLSCSGVGSCSGGYLEADYLQSNGLPPETAYPYTATDGDCSSASTGWQSSAYKIKSWGTVPQSPAYIKSALVAYGPLPTGFMVYEDFMHYKSGIYSYTTGKRLGGHAVLIVGYNDTENYFIVKNSWGPGWGEDGFFKIAYSEVDNAVNFGMSTIAYKADSHNPFPVPDVRFNSEDTWARTAPLFAPLLQWK